MIYISYGVTTTELGPEIVVKKQASLSKWWGLEAEESDAFPGIETCTQSIGLKNKTYRKSLYLELVFVFKQNYRIPNSLLHCAMNSSSWVTSDSFHIKEWAELSKSLKH
jgi:hypothetical protein